MISADMVAEISPSTNITSPDSADTPLVLVVDDEGVVCDVIEKFLQNFGYRVISTTSPDLALELLQREQFDVVLTDLQMGSVSGVDVLRAARRHQRDAIVILITGYPTVENAVQVLKEGAYDYITKPFRLDELGKVIQRGLEQQRLSREVVQLRESLSLYRISEAMNSTLELPHVLQMILNSAISEASCESGCIVLVDDRNEQLTVGAMRGELPPGLVAIDQLPADAVQQWLRFHETLTQPVQLGGPQDNGEPLCRQTQNTQALTCPICWGQQPNSISLCIPLKAKNRVIGLLYISRSYGGPGFEPGVIKALTILAGNAARAIENAQLYNNLHQDYLNIIKALSNAVEAKDPYTRGHSDRVVRYTQAIGNAFKLPLSDLEKLEVASILHDIGKIGISDQILLKPTGLSEEEFAQMKQHPIIGDRILQPIESLKEVRRWVYQHHERHDGLGYPEGISGEAIDFQARILIVAEVFDALVTERAYKKAWPLRAVIDYLQEHAGTHFDPEVVKVFTELLQKEGDEFSQFSRSSTFKILSPDDLLKFFKNR